MKLYGLSGLGADARVFQYLNLDYELISIDWIKPLINEGIKEYSLRISKIINLDEPFGLIGVSFGGLIAVEISKILKPKITVLISTAETRYDLRLIYRIIGKSRLLKNIPKSLFDPPRVIARWLFGTSKKALLNQILNDTDLGFAKWATNELVTWENQEPLNNTVLKIGGTHDKLIPTKKTNTKLIEGGEHFMIVDKAEEISDIINSELEFISLTS